MKTLDEIITQLLDGTLMESESVEFKRMFPIADDIIAKNLVGLANSGGGYLIFGISENTGGINVIGVNVDPDDSKAKIESIIKQYTTGVSCEISYLPINNVKVLIVSVEWNRDVAYFTRWATSPEQLSEYHIVRDNTGINRLSATSRLRYKVVFKYMTLDTFLTCMYNNNWRFYEPNNWSDKYERRFYCADYKITHSDYDTPQLFASCVTRAKNSEAAWKVYAHGQGLGAHCVQLRLDIVELRNQLSHQGYRFREKLVEYKDELYIQKLHTDNSPDYSYYFVDFSFDKFIKLLSLKRDAYAYEQEVRLFVIPETIPQERSHGKSSEHKDLKIDWSKIIRNIRIDKKCSDAEFVAIQQACFHAGINPVIKGYTFLGENKAPADSVDVDVERFDIDEMPGTQRLIIK